MTDQVIVADNIIVVQEIALSHSVTLTWVASVDEPSTLLAGEGYNVFRGTSAGNESATPLNASLVQATTYVDSTVTPGTYFYIVKAVINGAESIASDEVSAVILPLPPTSLVVSALV